MLKRLSLVVSGSFLVASVAFAEGEEATGGESAPAAETTAAPAKGAPAGKRAVNNPGVKRQKADPEAAKKMEECRNKCLTDKSTGDDRLKCFFACRNSIRGGVRPYAGFNPCAEASRKCRVEKCKVSSKPFSKGIGRAVAKKGPGAVVRPRPAVAQGKPGQSGQRPGAVKLGQSGQRPGAVKLGQAGSGTSRPGVATRAGTSEETRKCLQECRTAHNACLVDVLAKATPSGGSTTTATTETKTEEKPAESAATETKTEEKAAEGSTESSGTEGGSEGGSETP